MSTDSESPNSTDIHVDLGERYMSILNRVAEKYYGKNRTQALRRAIHFLEKRHNQDDKQRRLGDQIVKKLDEIIELVHTVIEKLETVEEGVEKLHRESVVEGRSNQQASEEAINEVYYELKIADRRLSVPGLIERTNLDPVELGLALNKLIDEEIVYEDSKGSTAEDRYGLHGVTYDD